MIQLDRLLRVTQRRCLDGFNGPQVIPPAYGLKGIQRITSTGDDEDLAYWNRYVGVTQMSGHGTFSEPRTGVNVTNSTDDLISAKLPPLQAYQLPLTAPTAPANSFDVTAAARGKRIFNKPDCRGSLRWSARAARLQAVLARCCFYQRNMQLPKVKHKPSEAPVFASGARHHRLCRINWASIGTS